MFFQQPMNNTKSFDCLNITYKLAQHLALISHSVGTVWEVSVSTGLRDNEMSQDACVWVSISSECVCKCVQRWLIWHTLSSRLWLHGEHVLTCAMLSCSFILCKKLIIQRGFIQLSHDKLLHASEPHGPTERPLASYLPHLWWFL